MVISTGNHNCCINITCGTTYKVLVPIHEIVTGNYVWTVGVLLSIIEIVQRHVYLPPIKDQGSGLTVVQHSTHTAHNPVWHFPSHGSDWMSCTVDNKVSMPTDSVQLQIKPGNLITAPFFFNNMTRSSKF